MRDTDQPSLFKLPPRVVATATEHAEHRALREQLSRGLRLGTMSWSFPGWRGLVYAEGADPKLLSDAGLTAYSQHPLLGAVEVDRSFYDPLPARYFQSLSEQVPDGFRFLVKAHEDVSMRSFPKHARYGKKQGDTNSRFLDAGYATDAVVGPTTEGLGDKLGALLLQLPPKFEPRKRVAGGFFRALRKRLEVPVVLEPRHAGWFTPAMDAWLAAQAIARVAADPARIPGAGEPGGWQGLVYYRWHGAPRMYWSAYGEEWLHERARDIARWPKGTQVWCIFDNTASGAATHNALALEAALARELA